MAVTWKVTGSCPVCYTQTHRIFRVRGEFDIRECPKCRHRFAEWRPPADHVTTVYDDSYFFGGGAGYPDYLSEGRILREHGRRYGQLLRHYTAPGTMLDVGAAAGFICDGFRETGWQPEALEPNPTMAAYGREKLGLAYHQGALEDFACPRQYDLVSMIQVLAHFSNIRAALHRAAEITRDGGFWLIETWNCRSLTARAFGKHWHEYNPPSVLHYFSAQSVDLLASQYGFERVAGGHPGKRIMWRHARSLLDNQISAGWFHSLTGLIPDEMVLPYPSEDLLWAFFRKGK